MPTKSSIDPRKDARYHLPEKSLQRKRFCTGLYKHENQFETKKIIFRFRYPMLYPISSLHHRICHSKYLCFQRRYVLIEQFE